MWGKRVDELDLAWEEILKTWGKQEESSAAPPLSDSPPSGPDHGSTSVVEAPVPLAWAPPASDWPGDHVPMEVYDPSADLTKTDHELPGLQHTTASPQLNSASQKRPWTEIGSNDDLMSALSESPPNPAKKPSTEPFDWSHWMSVVNPPPAHEYQVEHPPSHPGLPTDGSQMELPPSQGAESPTGFISLDDLGHEPESQMPHSLWQAAGPRTAPGNGLLYAPPPSPEASTNPDLQMMNAEYQLNPQAVTYGLKGKSKVPGQEDQPGSSHPSGA